MMLRQKNDNRRGFTLTELAIVLLVASSLLGALWIAAQGAWDNYKVYRANQQIGKFSQNIREYYMSCQQLPPGGCSTTAAAAGADETSAFDTLNLFPPEMRRNQNAAPGGSVIDNPFNGILAGGSLHVLSTACGGAGPLSCFRVQMQGLTIKACTRLLTFVPVNDTDIGIVKVGTQGMAGGTSSTVVPPPNVTASQANAWCNQAGTGNEVDWDSSNSATKRCGFTLVELAIVVGVIGLLFASIWVFATQSWENARQEQLKDETLSIIKNVRAFYSGQVGISGGFTAATTTAINSNLIPGNIVHTGNGCGGSCAESPWGSTAATAATGSLGICAWDPTGNGACTAATQPLFSIEIQGVPLASCIKAAIRNSDANVPAGFFDVVINGNSIRVQGTGFPPKPAVVQGFCNNASTIDFVYRLTQPQT